LPRKRKKEREISVRAPDYIPKRAPIFKDTTGTEALDVFTVAENVGRVLSFVMIAVGIFVIVLSVYRHSYIHQHVFEPTFHQRSRFRRSHKHPLRTVTLVKKIIRLVTEKQMRFNL